MQSAADQALQAGRQLVETPPEALVRLVRMVVRAFYSPEHAVVIDCLCKRVIVREEDLAAIFRLDLKQLRQILVVLKQDQLIRSRKRSETSADRVSKYEYFYINYEVFVNVVKYKLDTMQHRLEREQREYTARAAFHCTVCGKSFTDLEVNQLMDFSTGELKCSFCSAEVVEEENMASRKDLRVTVAKFHEQVRDPLDLLLKEIERFRLGPALLEPPISDVMQLGSSTDAGTGSSAAALAGDASTTTITVDMASSATGSGGAFAPGVKAVPEWLLGSAFNQDEDSNSRFSFDGGGGRSAAVGSAAPGGGGGDAARKEEIQDLLIQHEVRQKKPQQPSHPAAAAIFKPTTSSSRSTKLKKPFANYADDDEEDEDDAEDVDSSTSMTASDSDDESPGAAGPSSAKRPRGAAASDEDDDNDDEGDDELAVTFRGSRIPYDEVTEEMVQSMTPAEKQEYASVGQKFYAQFDD